jgi:hypothetical protein
MWNEVGVGDADAVGIIPGTSTRPRRLFRPWMRRSGRLAKPKHRCLNQRDVKTTLLNCLAASIPSRERVVTCEEVFELRILLAASGNRPYRRGTTHA